MKRLLLNVAAVYDRRPFPNLFSYGHRPPLHLGGTALILASLFAFTTTSCLAAATLTQQIDPAEVNVGDPVTVTLTVQNGTVKKKDTSSIFGMFMPSVDITLPPVDGLQAMGSSTQIMSVNGTSNTTAAFTLVPTRSGDFTIPAFDIHTQEGDVLHVKAMPFHVLGNGASLSTNSAPVPVIPSPAPSPAPSSIPSTNLPFNSNGPVVMPPNNGTASNAAGNSSNATTDSSANVPMESDGRPAKVFMVITPETTDAYVGQSIPLRIDWYIRLDVNCQQNSLPTIKGSDFLMSDLSYRPQEEEQTVMNEAYRRESWITAISAPKSGDFPLGMERDSYWIKSITSNNNDIFGGFFNRHANLAHEPIPSNQPTIHVHALPEEGRPAHFTGAIGQLKVTGDAQPGSVAVGEPVTLRFTVSGEGNFDYVRCPTLPDDPAWKTYVPSAKTSYADESHTHAVKTFEQAVIPQKNGNIPLPPASFSYFDPTAKQYVIVPIALPEITVTGSPTPLASASPGGGTDSTAAPTAPQALGFLPNRLELGSPRMSLTPVYRQPWFWAVQGGLIALPLLGALLLLLRSRSRPDDERAERALRQRSLHQEEDAMAEAVRRGDALAFFVAARHAIQLQLGAQWNLRPEALTLGEIRGRDPHLAETLEPLFAQADEVIYSGHASPDLDLAHWEHRVRTELLQPQPA
jgi:hypothetical protein